MSGESDKICKDGASKSNNEGVCDVNNMLQNMSTADKDNNNISICANCGKEGANNTCNKCNMVKYCNAVCKKVHKKKHKKDCEELISLATEKRNEELKLYAELHDKELFKQPPPAEDCPICFQRIPTLDSGATFMSCCRKRYVLDVYMLQSMIAKAMKLMRRSVPFVEFQFLNWFVLLQTLFTRLWVS